MAMMGQMRTSAAHKTDGDDGADEDVGRPQNTPGTSGKVWPHTAIGQPIEDPTKCGEG